MATTGTEKHFRLCLVLMKAGTKASCCLLMKRVKDLCPGDHDRLSLDEFLLSKKKKILKAHIGKEKIQILFPKGRGTDLSKWDLSLLCCILTQFCELPRLTCLDVERLRTIRNELCHVREPTIDNESYRDYLKTINVVVRRILEETDEECTKCEVERIVRDIENQPLSLEETLREMHKFYALERDIREKLDHMSEVEETVLAKVKNFDRLLDKKVETIDTKLEEIHKSLEEKQRATPCSFVFPDLEFHINLMNLSPEKEENMSEVLVQLFEEAINEDEDFRSKLPAESFVKLREVVNKTVRLFLSKGWQVVKTKRKCVQLNIRCNSFASLAVFFQEYIQGRLELELEELNAVISELTDERAVTLETVIYKDEFWRVMNDTLSSLEEYMSKESGNEAALTDVVETNDDKIDTGHSLLLTTSRRIPENMHAHDSGKGNLRECLKEIENELWKEFDAPELSLRADCFVDRLTIKDAEIIECGNDVSTIEQNAETDWEALKLDFPSRSNSMEEYFATKAEDENTGGFQTIAILELYRAQTSVANHLELIYLHLHDHLDIAEEVRLITSYVKTLHTISTNLIRKMHCTVTEIKRKLVLLSDAISFQTAKLLEIKLNQIIPLAEDMSTETERALKSYKDIQTSVHKSIEQCKGVRRKQPEKQSSGQQLQQIVEYGQEESSKAKQAIYHHTTEFQLEGDKSVLSGATKQLPSFDKNLTDMNANRDKPNFREAQEKEKEKQEGFCETFEREKGALQDNTAQQHEDVNINETMLASTLRPGTAMTGGIKGKVFGRQDAHRNIFEMFHHRSAKITFESLMKWYADSQSASLHGPHQQLAVFAEMYEERTEALSRLERLKRLGAEDVERLQEVLVQIQYIEVQLTRIANSWSSMTSLMKIVTEKLSADPSCMSVSLYRFVELISSITLDWSWFESICQDYVKESDAQIEELYKFLLVTVEKMSTEERFEREQQLICGLEERILKTFPTNVIY